MQKANPESQEVREAREVLKSSEATELRDLSPEELRRLVARLETALYGLLESGR